MGICFVTKEKGFRSFHRVSRRPSSVQVMCLLECHIISLHIMNLRLNHKYVQEGHLEPKTVITIAAPGY